MVLLEAHVVDVEVGLWLAMCGAILGHKLPQLAANTHQGQSCQSHSESEAQ